MNKNKIIQLIIFSKYLLDLLPNYIKFIKIYKDEICIYVKKKYLTIFINFFKNHIICKFNQLIDICGVDYPNKKKRFEVVYNVLSIYFNFRVRIKVQVDEISPINSVSKIFKSSLWLEREVWDMYGIFFSNHEDLRRILTDYGFEGYPFRKDFPQIGFVEVRYDDKKKHVLYEPVELAQEYRLFNFLSPWIQVK